MKKLFVTAAAAVLAAGAANAQKAAPAPTPAQVDSLSRAVASYVGPSIANLISNLAMLDANVDMDVFLAALNDAARGETPAFTVAEADAYIDKFVKERRPFIPDSLDLASEQAFVKAIGAEKGAVTLPSGLVLITEKAGSGDFPTDTTMVEMTYTGRFSNGYVFDSTEEPVETEVGELVEGFSEGLKMMQPGGRYRLVIPASLAYGPQGVKGNIPGNAALDFTVELLAIKP
ncbi:MAG: FKBP-type peptidyl-prolyl cis-trans isomerase [Muribaculaceae bacterium]|nr:FKBP-type peptidyl-prolyl cis-trans isomerase [Muribaculaceae bacterium]